MSITDEWLQCFEEDKQKGLLGRIFWRLAGDDHLPEGVNEEDPQVIAALDDIRAANPPRCHRCNGSGYLKAPRQISNPICSQCKGTGNLSSSQERGT